MVYKFYDLYILSMLIEFLYTLFRTSEDVSRLLKLLPQSSTDIQTTIIRILKRFLEKGSSLALVSLTH